MAPTTPSIRTAVKARLVELIAADVPDDNARDRRVQVSHGWPGRDMRHECIWVGNVTGTVEVPSMKAGRKRVHDNFDVDVWVVAGFPGQHDPAAAETRCEELTAYVRDQVADDPHLGGLPGLTGGAKVTLIEGPDSEPTDEGAVAIARVVVSCRTSLE